MIINRFKNKYGPWALVIGAAEGLGESYTIALAKKGLNIIMLDSKKKPMENLSERIREEFKLQTIQIHIDIGHNDAIQIILETIQNIECSLLIYNAASSIIKPFVLHTQKEITGILEVNVNKQIQLVHGFSRYLIENNRNGGILMMSSLAGLIGMQLVSPYAASKAFAWNLAEAISHELKPKNIDVMACIAGATSTPAYNKTNPKYGFFKPTVMDPDSVANKTLNKLGKRTLYIPGFFNRLNYFILLRLLPRKLASKMANKTMLNMYTHHIQNEL